MRAACFLVVIIIVLWEMLVIGVLVVGGVGHWPLKIKIFVNGCPLLERLLTIQNCTIFSDNGKT